ncbi:MAG TPA: hypothetical protein DD381_12315 [Lentisphaeria bacterium]|nr:MAG: hypothetical protein A2X47_09420 [Lentisphaerae bacterium GWF2_38_69]HBM17110.1 hypothetical protein [Lentisphaeria bacterium]
MNDLYDKRLCLPSRKDFESLEEKPEFFTTASRKRIAYYQYGDPKGHPLLFYHGTGSHIQAMCLHKPALEYGFRIIAPDRPGVGLSEFSPGWSVLEFARDIGKLTDHLGLDSFGIVGISGAGPTLMASAYVLEKRLKCVIDLACAMPLYKDKEALSELGGTDRFYARLGTRLPLIVFQFPFSLIGITMKFLKKPELFAKMFKSSLCPADQEIFSIPDFQYFLMKDFQTLFRNGSKAAAHDAQNVYRNWGFSLSEIKTHIEGFQGTADKFIPPVFSSHMAKTVLDSNLNLIEGQGHFCHIVYCYNTLRKIKELFY